MSFLNVSKLKDVRTSLTRHRTRRYSSVGISRKEDVAIHHSLTRRNLAGSNAEGYAKYHVNSLGWPGIGYHFVIESDGTIKWCNSIDHSSYHVGNYNARSIGICLSGDFRYEEPTAAQKESLVALVNALKKDMPNFKRILGHNDYPGYENKQCPVFNWKAVLNNTSPALPSPTRGDTHTIKKGDTLYSIALKNNMEVAEILELNDGIDPHNLKIGQIIYLKNKSPNQPSPPSQGNTSRKVIGYATVLVPYLNRRAEASFNSRISGTVQKGQRFEVYDKKNGLYDIGSLGWISAGTTYTRFEPTSSGGSQSIQLPTGTLRRGDRGEGVRQLQRALNRLNYRVGAEDGIFGKNTENGVRRFQSVYLPRQVDGIYGPNTRREMEKLL